METDKEFFKDEKMLSGSAYVLVFPKTLRLTDEGRRIVSEDPNVSRSTIERLFESERQYLRNQTLKNRFVAGDYQSIFREFFVENSQIGMVHLGMIASENLNQCLADLISVYSDECQISFLDGAMRIRSYLSIRPIIRFFRVGTEYATSEWSPQIVYIPKADTKPPTRKPVKKIRRTYSTKRKAVRQPLPRCPLCGSKAQVFRCGIGMTEWHVCCIDSENVCQNFFGLKSAKTQREAALNWIEYCAHSKSNSNYPG